MNKRVAGWWYARVAYFHGGTRDVSLNDRTEARAQTQTHRQINSILRIDDRTACLWNRGSFQFLLLRCSFVFAVPSRFLSLVLNLY